MENKIQQELGLYKSQDFYLTAICIGAGLNLVRLDRENGKFITFVLNDPNNEAPKIISKHWSREFKIPSRDIIEAINELKTRMYSGA